METSIAPRRALPVVRTGQESARISRSEFERRCQEQFYDPAFDGAKNEISHRPDPARESYPRGVRSPGKRRAGDAEYGVPVEWLETRTAILKAQQQHEGSEGPSRILLICGSPGTDETCPSEMSKTFRVANTLRERLEASGCEVDFLDLSRMTSDYGRVIYSRKGCVPTAIYPRWVAAHGVMIVSPGHWLQAPSVLKLMMDRLVGADGGNLAGRVFSLIVHGEVEGASELRRALHDWLTAMELVPTGAEAMLDFEEYATSHEALDHDAAFMQEASNAAAVLMMSVAEMRAGRKAPGEDIHPAHSK